MNLLRCVLKVYFITSFDAYKSLTMGIAKFWQRISDVHNKAYLLAIYDFYDFSGSYSSLISHQYGL